MNCISEFLGHCQIFLKGGLAWMKTIGRFFFRKSKTSIYQTTKINIFCTVYNLQKKKMLKKDKVHNKPIINPILNN